jgi:hypothetical protein
MLHAGDLRGPNRLIARCLPIALFDIVNTAGGSGQITPKTGASQSAGGAVFKPIDAAYTVTPLQWRDKINFCDVQKSTRLVLRIKAMGSRK